MTISPALAASKTTIGIDDPSRGSGAFGRASHLLLGGPGLQRMRAAQSLLAFGVFVVFAGVQAFEVSYGLMDRVESNALSCLNFVASLLFFLLIRSGLNTRFASDPSLTFAQCLFGIVSVGISYALTGPARGAVMGIMLLILVFAMFALPPRKIRILALCAFGILITVMLWRSATLPQRYPIEVESTHLFFAVIIVTAISVLSARMGSLRERLHRQKAELQHALEQNQRLATLDDLTGLANRRHMTSMLRTEVERVRRGADTMSAVLVDIDLFKRVNDRYGHAAGDLVLKRFADLTVQTLRTCDCASRWGGEEFLILLPGTGREQALQSVDRLRVAFSALRWPEIDDGLQITFSAGVVRFRGDEPIDALIERADQCMYAAKTSGRNCIRDEPLDAVASRSGTRSNAGPDESIRGERVSRR